MICRISRSAALSAAVIIVALISSCTSSLDEDDVSAGVTITFESSFSKSTDGWFEGFSDYRPGRTEDNYYELVFAYSSLPPYLGQNMFGFYISGNNHNSDLFMFIKRQLTGMMPDTDYHVSFRVEIASDAPLDGGSGPGSMVYMKAGVSLVEPRAVDVNNYYQMNVDKGNQESTGKDAVFLGNIGITGQTEDAPYKLKVLSNEAPFAVTTDGTGKLWVFIGTDSGYEGVTGIYYSSIKITLKEQ